jgi:hypothetical protein
MGVNIKGRKGIMANNLSQYIASTFSHMLGGSQPSVMPVLNCFNEVIYCKLYLGPLSL